MSELETRGTPVNVGEIRAIEDGEGKRLFGYGIVFDSLSQDLGGFREIISPAAVTRTMSKDNDVLVTMNHNNDLLLGRTGSGTARIGADQIGVFYDVLIPDTGPGRDAWALAARDDLPGSSFTFSIPQGGDRWERDEEGKRVRTITELALYELGPVATPAYRHTTVAARSTRALADFMEAEQTASDDEEQSGENADGETREHPLLTVVQRRLRTVR